MNAIDLYNRPSADFEAKVEATLGRLQIAAQAHANRIVQATSLGVEDMVLTDLIARHHLPIALATLETGMLHAQTLTLIQTIEQRYEVCIEIYRPQTESVVAFVREHGDRAMYESIALRKRCCALRKLEPLERMLASRTAWVTGLRREQSGQRAEVPFEESDDQARTKYSPLAEWTWGDVWHYVATHHVPYNALHDAFMPSIGCEPCTRAIAVGEDFRAGRWWWEHDDQKECGLHAHADTVSSPLASSLNSTS